MHSASSASLRVDMSAAVIVGFILLGLCAGTYGTLVGVGGGILVVPVLLLAHVPAKEAAGTSMAVVLANAASGALTFLRERRVDVRSGLVFAIAGIPGAIIGGFADQYMPRGLFGALFATLLLIVGLRLFLQPGSGPEVLVASGEGTKGFRELPAALIGLGAGFIASIFGIGGGIIFVPSMVYLFGFPAHVATATSTFIIALTAIVATASHAYYHDVLWGPAAAIAIGAIVGAQIGAWLAARVPVARLMRIFSSAVLLAALWLFYKALN